MKKLLKSICTVLVMALVFTMVPTLTAVTEGHSSYFEAYAAAKVYEKSQNISSMWGKDYKEKLAGKYFWAVGTKLYCSTKKSGKGTILFSGSSKKYNLYVVDILTNGTKAYFVIENSNRTKSYLYSVNTNGKNRKLIRTAKGDTRLVTVYKSKVYFIDQSNNLKEYNTKTKKTKTTVSDFGFTVTSVDNGRMLLGTAYYTDPLSYYICDTGEKGKTKENVFDWALHDYGYPIYYYGKKENGVCGVFSQTPGKDDYREIAEVSENWGLVEFKLSEGKAYFSESIYTDTSLEIIEYTVDLNTGETKEISRVTETFEDDYYDDDYDDWE